MSETLLAAAVPAFVMENRFVSNSPMETGLAETVPESRKSGCAACAGPAPRNVARAAANVVIEPTNLPANRNCFPICTTTNLIIPKCGKMSTNHRVTIGHLFYIAVEICAGTRQDSGAKFGTTPCPCFGSLLAD